MKKKICTFVAIALTAVIAIGMSNINSNEGLSVMAQSNIDALTQDNEFGYFKVKERISNKCTIYVGAKGSIKLFSGTILTADGTGYITFDGQVTCIGTGDVYCKPVECVDLYSIVL